jgi:hypothetical protein
MACYYSAGSVVSMVMYGITEFYRSLLTMVITTHLEDGSYHLKVSFFFMPKPVLVIGFSSLATTISDAWMKLLTVSLYLVTMVMPTNPGSLLQSQAYSSTRSLKTF